MINEIIPTEDQEGKALVDWWSMACGKYRACPDDLAHIPNGGDRHAVVGAKMKAQGTRRGMPDYLLTISSARHPVLWIELKRRKGGRLSDHQKIQIARLRARGHAVCVCHGWESAKEAIEQHLRQKEVA